MDVKDYFFLDIMVTFTTKITIHHVNYQVDKKEEVVEGRQSLSLSMMIFLVNEEAFWGFHFHFRVHFSG